MCIIAFHFKKLFYDFGSIYSEQIYNKLEKDIAAKFMEYYIYAPYKKIMKTSQSDKIYTLETLTGVAVDGFVMRGLNLMTNVIIVGMIIALLFIKFPVPALGTVIFVVTTMFLQNKYFKNAQILLLQQWKN